MRAESGAISVSHGAAYFMPQGQRGGWGIILSNNGTLPYSFIPLILRGLSPYSSPHAGRSVKIRGDDSDPPRNGVSLRPRVAVLWDMPFCGPQGVAIVLIHPCGKAKTTRLGEGAGSPFPERRIVRTGPRRQGTGFQERKVPL